MPSGRVAALRASGEPSIGSVAIGFLPGCVASVAECLAGGFFAVMGSSAEEGRLAARAALEGSGSPLGLLTPSAAVSPSGVLFSFARVRSYSTRGVGAGSGVVLAPVECASLI